jgi:hypothetical protein
VPLRGRRAPSAGEFVLDKRFFDALFKAVEVPFALVADDRAQEQVEFAARVHDIAQQLRIAPEPG